MTAETFVMLTNYALFLLISVVMDRLFTRTRRHWFEIQQLRREVDQIRNHMLSLELRMPALEVRSHGHEERQ
jgi:hypothetical protein